MFTNPNVMKKILLCLIAVCTTASINAQIQIQKSFKNSLIIIGNISSGTTLNALSAFSSTPSERVAEHRLYCRIFDDKTTYGILVDTENRFDDDFEFALGTDIDKARVSLNSLIALIEDSELDTSYTVKDEDERTIQINVPNHNCITLKAINAHGDVICDTVVLLKKNLERALSLLDTKAEAKVLKALEKAKK